jgi:antitoxin HigA-1
MIESKKMFKNTLSNPSAGEILKKEFLDEINLSQNALAAALHVPANRILDIIRGRRSITADTDLRLCKFFNLTEGYFLRLQLSYEIAGVKKEIADQIKCIKPYSVLHVRQSIRQSSGKNKNS